MCDIFACVNIVKTSNSVKIDTFSGCNDTVHSAMEMKEKDESSNTCTECTSHIIKEIKI